jgi:phosphate-selective porin OprO/OprP
MFSIGRIINLMIFWMLVHGTSYANSIDKTILIYSPPSLFEKPVYLDKTNEWLILGSKDNSNQLALHGLLDYHPDLFLNYQGLNVNLGRTASFIYNQNNVMRSWLYNASPYIEATLDRDIHFLVTPDFGKSQVRLRSAVLDVNYFRLMSFRAGLQKSLMLGLEGLLNDSAFKYNSFTVVLSPCREIGFLVYGSLGPQRPQVQNTDLSYLGFNDWFSLQLGIFNGAPDSSDTGVVPFGISAFSINFEQSVLNSTSKAFEGRVFLNPFIACQDSFLQNLGFGFATSTQRVNNSQNLPDLLSLGQNPIFSFGYPYPDLLTIKKTWAQGIRSRIHPQFVWYKSVFAVTGDWTQTVQHLSAYEHTPKFTDEMDSSIIAQKNKAYQMQFIFNLTGEDFKFGHVTPKHNFNPGSLKEIGALQFFVRLTNLFVDPKTFKFKQDENFSEAIRFATLYRSVQQASAYSVGVNWFWNEYIRMGTEFSHTQFVGGCSTGAYNDPYKPGCLTAGFEYVYAKGSEVTNRPDENAFFQRIQIIF